MTQSIAATRYAGSPAENYERYFVPQIAEPLARDLLDDAGLRPGERVLDVGCGTGIVARLAAERIGAAGIAGVDGHPGMLAVARKAASDPGIEWHEADAAALPFGDETFDVALAQMVLQFVGDRRAALAETLRVLSPGGRVVLNVPGPTPPLLAVIAEALARHVGPEAAAFVGRVFSLHDPAEVGALLESAGYEDVEAWVRRTELVLPPAAEFLWQYTLSTPLAEAVGRLDESRLGALEDDVVQGAARLGADGGGAVELDVTTAVGRRP